LAAYRAFGVVQERRGPQVGRQEVQVDKNERSTDVRNFGRQKTMKVEGLWINGPITGM
jgi:hypothetical protein